MPSTESLDARFTEIDSWATATAVEAMAEGQLAAAAAVCGQTDAIARAADAAADRLGGAGRMVFAGAGTSGRIAVQDGVELGPTFGWPTERLVFLLAGGLAALAAGVEGAEDDTDAARASIGEQRIGGNDIVVGVAASGRTPFTLAALQAARAAGALTIALANNRDAPLLEAAEFGILVETGSEIIGGSTRMKAGTAQKIALNLLTTAIMLRLGRVYRGRMVDMVVSNAKLRERAKTMVMELADVTAGEAANALESAGDEIRRAVLIAKGCSRAKADNCLEQAGGRLRRALEILARERR